MRRWLLGCGLALAALTSADAQPERMRELDPLAGGWVPVRIGTAAFPAIPHARVFFSQGTDYSTQAGCGNFVGRYALEAARIRTRRIDPVVTSKCDQPGYARWERLLSDALAGASSWKLQPDGTLRITTAGGAAAVFRRPAPAVPALAGRWELERIGTETIAAGRSVRVDFDGEGVSALAECNAMGGEVVPVRGGFTVRNASSTQIGCGPEREAFDERLFAAVASARRHTALADGRVRLEGGPEPLLLRRFRLQPAQQQLPGRYFACGSNPRGVMYAGEAKVVFEGSTVRDNSGCEGRYTTQGARLDIRLAPSPACSRPAAAGEADVEIGGDHSLLAVLRPDGYAFDEEGRLRVRTRRGLLDLCREGHRWFGSN